MGIPPSLVDCPDGPLAEVGGDGFELLECNLDQLIDLLVVDFFAGEYVMDARSRKQSNSDGVGDWILGREARQELGVEIDEGPAIPLGNLVPHGALVGEPLRNRHDHLFPPVLLDQLGGNGFQNQAALGAFGGQVHDGSGRQVAVDLGDEKGDPVDLLPDVGGVEEARAAGVDEAVGLAPRKGIFPFIIDGGGGAVVAVGAEVLGIENPPDLEPGNGHLPESDTEVGPEGAAEAELLAPGDVGDLGLRGQPHGGGARHFCLQPLGGWRCQRRALVPFPWAYTACKGSDQAQQG